MCTCLVDCRLLFIWNQRLPKQFCGTHCGHHRACRWLNTNRYFWRLNSDDEIWVTYIYGNVEGVWSGISLQFLAGTKQREEHFFRLSVRLSVCHTFFHNVLVIVSPWRFLELLLLTYVMTMQKIMVRGQGSRSQRSQPSLVVFGCNSGWDAHMLMKWCTELDVA